MKTIRSTILGAALAVLLSPSSALAFGEAGVRSSCPLGTLISAKPMNGAASTLTFQLQQPTRTIRRCDPLKYDELIMYVDFTHDNDGTITATCTVSDDAGTTYFEPTTGSELAGTLTLSYAGVIVTPAALTADKKFAIRLGISSYKDIKCVFSHGGTPAAGDILTVTGDLVTK